MILKDRQSKTDLGKALEIEKLYKDLSPEEKATIDILLKDLSKNTDKTLLDTLRESEYIRPMVDIETFVKDPYYLGATCSEIYPVLMEDLKEIAKGGYTESIHVGATRTGKTFIASIIVCRFLYWLSCLKNPQKSLGISAGSKIACIVLSANEMLAREVAFDNIVTKVSASPYFNENFAFIDNKGELRFPNNIVVVAKATTDRSALGHNIALFWLDEAAFFGNNKKIDPKFGHVDNAEVIYLSLKTRMKNTFKKSKFQGMGIISSSKGSVDDFLSRHLEKIRNDPSVFVTDRNAWSTMPELYEESPRFYVLVGNELMSSRIIEEEELHLFENLPDGVSIIDVPEEFKPDFTSNLEASIRDLGGIETTAISPFIQRREKILEACDPNKWPSVLKHELTKEPLLKHNFSCEEWEPTKEGKFMWERMVKTNLEREYDGSYTNILRPIISPKAVRAIHFDPAFRSDSFGISMAHVIAVVNVKRRAQDGSFYTERAPVYVVDFMLRINPPVGGEIEMSTARHLVYQLQEHGYNIGCVSMDKYVRDGLQPFKAKGFKAEWISVDETTEPYDVLKSALYENRIFFYKYDRLIQELQLLEKKYEGKRVKIDHPPHFGKDLADSLAGVIYSLSQKDFSGPLPFLTNSSYETNGDPWLDSQLMGSKAEDKIGKKDLFDSLFFSSGNDDVWSDF